MTRLKSTSGSGILLLVLTSSCHSAAAPQVAHPPQQHAAVATAPVVPAEQAEKPAAPALGDRTQQFLVHSEQQIVLFSTSSEAKQVLVPHADAALYQPELELLWFRDKDRFFVLDLRSPGAPAINIARGIPDEDRFRIARGKVRIDANDGCDLPYVSLEWSEAPVLAPFLTEAPDLKLENTAWLLAELARPGREPGEARAPGGKLRLPKNVGDCEFAQACGKTVPFGAGDKQLVLVKESTGGDCIERACFVHDPRTGLFATPPKAEKWGNAKTTAPGSCGPYLFDQTRTSFLVDHRLCTLEQGCKALGGEALGWLVPGESVGWPGSGDASE